MILLETLQAKYNLKCFIIFITLSSVCPITYSYGLYYLVLRSLRLNNALLFFFFLYLEELDSEHLTPMDDKRTDLIDTCLSNLSDQY
jgi:hypothetical protein